jgi:hypothetical protein
VRITPCSADCGLPGVLGEVPLLEQLAQLLGLRLLLVDLAELLLDRAELLAQEVLALAAVHLGLDLRLDPAADLDELQLTGEDLGEQAQPLGHVALLEQPLLVLGLDPQRRGDHVRQLGGVVHVGDRQLELLGEVRQLLDDPRERGLDVAHERLELGRGDDLVGHLGDAGDEVRLGGDEVAELDPLPALDEDAHRAVGHFQHPGHHADDAHAIEVVRPGLLLLRVLRRDHDEHPVAAEHVVQQLDRALLADGEGHHRVGERNAVAQRKDRQCLRERGLDVDLHRLAVHGWHVDGHESLICTRRTD